MVSPPVHAHRLRPAQVLRLVLGILLPVLVVGYVAEDVLEKQRFAFERPVLEWLHHLATPTLDNWAVTVTTLGSVSIIAPVSLLILAFLWWKFRRLALFWMMAVGGAALLNVLMKLIFARTRPDLWPTLVKEVGASFPSGHSMYSMAFVVALMLMVWNTAYRWPAVILGTLFTLSVGLSRVYLGVHYPTDVLCGWLSGLAWVLGIYSLMTRRHTALERSAAS